MSLMSVVIGLVIGIPMSALAYWYTKRNQALYGSRPYSGDYSPGDGGGGADGGGGDSSA